MSESENKQGEFIVKILETLTKNGFPGKHVSLPLEKMYETASSRGINFNRILDFLKLKEGVGHRKDGDRIIFFKEEADNNVSSDVEEDSNSISNPFPPGFDLGALGNMDFGSIMQQASGILKNMTPEQMSQAMEMAKNMTGGQMEQLQNMFGKLDPEQIQKMKEQIEKMKP